MTSRFRVVRAEGRNIPQRLNLGLRLARGEVIARMDAHAIFPAAYLADGVIRLGRGDVASVSGPQIAAGDGLWSRRIAIAMRSWLGRGGARFRRVLDGEIEIESGYCGLWHRSLLLAHGGWDERAWKGEDMEFAARITRSGGRIICVPQMAARYLPRESLPELARQYWNYAYLRSWDRSPPPVGAPHALTCYRRRLCCSFVRAAAAPPESGSALSSSALCVRVCADARERPDCPTGAPERSTGSACRLFHDASGLGRRLLGQLPEARSAARGAGTPVPMAVRPRRAAPVGNRSGPTAPRA